MLSLAKLVAVLGTVYILGVLFSTGPFFPTQAVVSQPTVSSSAATLADEPVRQTDTRQDLTLHDAGEFQGNGLVFKAADAEFWTAQMAISTQADIQLTGILARTTLTQTFVNDTEDFVNATYYFPLPEDAAVDHMTFRVGERQIIGKIMPKENARVAFEQARKQGKKASLVSQHRPNLFSNNIAHIGPGEGVTVTLEYQQSVTPKDDAYRLRLPLAITPRYSPGSTNEQNANPVAKTVASHNAFNSALTVSVTLDAGIPITDIHSPSHTVSHTLTDKMQNRVSFSGSSAQDRDFILDWRAAERDAPVASWFTETFNDEVYHLVMVSPPNDVFSEQDRIPRAWTFVVDTSGSMSGESMRQAKQALQASLRKLHNDEYFNIILFSDEATRLWSQPVLASQQAIGDAMAYVSEIEANGGTEMLSALSMALDDDADLPQDVLQQIIFLTDGAVSNEHELMTYIQSNIASKRLFTVGIGSAPNSYFMREAASVGRGSFTFIASPEDVLNSVSELLETLRFPALQDIEMSSHTPLELMPSLIPDVYRGEPLVLSFRTTSEPEHLDLSALAGRNRRQWRAYLDSPTAGQGVHVLWARRHIDTLRKQRRNHPSPTELTQRIQEVAMQHHIVSESTSLIAVDDALSNPTPEFAEQQRLAAMRTLAMALPQTATKAGQLFLNGLLLAVLAVFVWLCGRRVA